MIYYMDMALLIMKVDELVQITNDIDDILHGYGTIDYESR